MISHDFSLVTSVVLKFEIKRAFIKKSSTALNSCGCETLLLCGGVYTILCSSNITEHAALSSVLELLV